MKAPAPAGSEGEASVKICRLLLVGTVSSAVVSGCALAQQAAPAASAERSLERWRESKFATLKDDFGELGRYRDPNASLKPPAAGESRVVFFGDSITDMWKLEEYFPGKPYINRGIGGQTTPQMLVRFRQDAISL